jgi:hypothetical protein
MPHPYVAYENAVAWRAIAGAIGELEDNHDLELRTARPYVIGLLCERLAASGVDISARRESGPLHSYWFSLSEGLGIGLTALDANEALELAEATRAEHFPKAMLRGVVTDIRVAQLDQGHVVPNMGPIVVRGVWFPRLNG